MIAELQHIRGAPEEIYGPITQFFFLTLQYVCPCHHNMARPDVGDRETVCRYGE